MLEKSRSPPVAHANARESFLYADRAKRLLQCGNTWDSSYQTLSLWLFGDRNEAAYFSSVYRLSFGIICGMFHSCGLSRALVVLIPCICYPLEMRYRSWERYEAPYNPCSKPCNNPV